MNLATLTRYLNFQFLQLYEGCHSAYFKELLLGLTELLHASLLEQYLAHSKCSSILAYIITISQGMLFFICKLSSETIQSKIYLHSSGNLGFQ